MGDDVLRILVLAAEPRPELAALVSRAVPAALVRQLPPGREPARVLRETRPDVIVLGACLVDGGGAEAVLRALGGHEAPLVVALSEAGDPRTAVRLARAGVVEWIPMGEAPHLLAEALRVPCVRRSARRPRAPTPPEGLPPLVGTSPALDEVRRGVRTAADTSAPVLIEGETGTGKEVVARRIHGLGPRATSPFVPVNCAAIPEPLAESELFGHARGAFTGAVQDRVGAIAMADGGTLFLDELEELPLPVQAKLLRILQDGELRPVGSVGLRRVDARIVAASNRDLWSLVESGRFRSDLYYRLRVLTIQLPPLRDRPEDVLELAGHFVSRFNAREGTAFRLPAPSHCRPLLSHAWPGNVRELENVLEALLIRARAAGHSLDDALADRPGPGGTWPDERTRILRVLETHRWNRQRTADALGISRVTLWRRMERHGIRNFVSDETGTGNAVCGSE